MCGIYGYIGEPKNVKKMYKLIKTLAVVSEVRGIDGAGFFALYDEEVIMEKTNSRASTFIIKSNYIKDAIVNKKATLYVGHNRMASMGSVDDVNNTHPIMGDELLLVHNGTCFQAKSMLKKIGLDNKMKGSVDSEAVLHLLEHYGINEDVFAHLNNYSLVIFNYTNGELFFVRDREKPMVIYDFRNTLGVRLFASTEAIIEASLEYCKIKAEPLSCFHTKSYCIYEADPFTGEIENMGGFTYEVPEPEPETETNYYINTSQNEIGLNFGRRGYAAPNSSYSLGWSGGSFDD